MSSLSLCTQLGTNIMMLDMETELESLSRDTEGTENRLKRTNQEADYDQERSHVKKRRKQSKPVRITSSDPVNENADFMKGIQTLEYTGVVNHFLTDTLLEESLQNFSSSEDLDETEVIKRSNEQYDEQSEIQNHEKENEETAFPLNLSNIKPSTSFGDSIMSSQMIDTGKLPKQQAALDVSLFAYQSSSSSPEGTPKKTTPQDKMFLSSPALLLPFVKQNQMPNSSTQGGSPLRIFNPEAFCDLCNKEFCNKYFLKTHKANKHGIYMDNIGGPTILDTLPSLPFINYFPNNCDTPNQTLPRTINVVKKVQVPQTSNLVQLKTNINTGNGSMRAFCNICQREFCNKYFVRRHKAKIHGIIDPNMKDGFGFEGQEFKNPGSTVPITGMDKSESSVNDNELLIGQTNSFYFGGEKNDIQNTEFNTEAIVVKQERDNETESDGCIKTFPVPLSVQASAVQIPQNEDLTRDGALSPDRLKRTGIVNTDAFCDICCKEYCNKYFLRTHKLKCHGIITTDFDKKEDKMNGNSVNQTWYSSQSQIQTVPLNLIVGDQGTNSLDTTGRTHYDTDTEDQTTCNVCGRYFQNQVLLKMHVSSVHSNKDLQTYITHSVIKENKDCEKMCKPTRSDKPMSETTLEIAIENTDTETNKNVSFDSIQKLHSMIVKLSNSNSGENTVCEVCNQDIGQPSMLETHILKEHSNLLEEIGSVFDEDNSNSQNSFIVPTYGTKTDCTYCQKSFLNSVLLEHHISECHSEPEQINIPSSPVVSKSLRKENNDILKCSAVNSLTPQTDRQGVQTPTSSFCEICKKELCNKYFMKTHMQRMHGISIENGAHIGGVVCDICNKELCSKYFLRVHKQNSHGIVDEVFLPQLTVESIRNQSPNADVALKPSEQTDLNHRYFSHFTEVCVICNRRFRSTKWLKAHLLNDHGEEGKDKWKEFQIQLDMKPQIEKNAKENMKKLDQPVSTSICGSLYKPNMSITLSETNTVRYDNTLTRPSSVEKLQQPNMFAMLINEKDNTAKQYQCSYCSFSTPILAFLFVHERSHLRNSAICRTDQENNFKCNICLQIYDSKDLLDKHLFSHKQTGVIPYATDSFSSTQDFVKHFQTMSKSEYECLSEKEILTENKAENIMQNENEMAQISEENKFKQNKNLTMREKFDSPSEDHCNVLVTPYKISDENSHRCTKCDFTSNDLNVYNDHIITEHKNEDGNILSHRQRMNSELVGTLEKVKDCLSLIASKAEIPALFAVPQTQCQYTMQPFVLEDSSENKESSSTTLESKLGKSFLSSLVFLPVREMLKKPVTASFKLTPT